MGAHMYPSSGIFTRKMGPRPPRFPRELSSFKMFSAPRPLSGAVFLRSGAREDATVFSAVRAVQVTRGCPRRRAGGWQSGPRDPLDGTNDQALSQKAGILEELGRKAKAAAV